MPTPYRARLDERTFLNFAGFHSRAYVSAYVEDTTDRQFDEDEQDWFAPSGPRVILEVADCSNRINLEFDVASDEARENSLHKVDTLLGTLQRFRGALEQECRLAAEREREQQERRWPWRRGRRRLNACLR